MTPDSPGKLTSLTDVALIRVGGLWTMGHQRLEQRTPVELSLGKSQAMRLAGGSFEVCGPWGL